MSWLSKATGIHIGFGPPKVNFNPLPPDAANDPQVAAAYQDMQNHVNGTVDQARTYNTAAAIAAAAAAPFALGAGGGAAGGGAAGGAGAAGASGGVGGIASSIPGWVLDGIKAGLPAAINWIKNNAGTLLQGAGVADAAYREMQADKYATQAFKMAQDAYNAKAPLRAAGIAGMQAPTGNPFSTNQHTAGYAPPTAAPIPMGTSGPASGPRPPAGPNVPMGTPINFGRLTNLTPGQ